MSGLVGRRPAIHTSLTERVAGGRESLDMDLLPDPRWPPVHDITTDGSARIIMKALPLRRFC